MTRMPAPLLAELTPSNWLSASIIAASALAIAFSVRRFTRRRIRRVDTSAEAVDAGGRVISVGILSLGAFYTMRALDVELVPAFGALGIGIVFIAVGLQPLLVNLVGSFVIQARRPFRRGDQISTNGFKGTVIAISYTSTELLSYNGEKVHVPNEAILSNPLVNWTHERIRRTEMPITVPYGCDLTKVLRTLGRTTRETLDDEDLPPAEALATRFGDHGIELELLFWHYSDELESRAAINQVIVAIDQALREIDVEIPYPQLVMHRPTTTVTGAVTPPTTAEADPGD